MPVLSLKIYLFKARRMFLTNYLTFGKIFFCKAGGGLSQHKYVGHKHNPPEATSPIIAMMVVNME